MLKRICLIWLTVLMLFGTGHAFSLIVWHPAAQVGGPALADKVFAAETYWFPDKLSVGTDSSMERDAQMFIWNPSGPLLEAGFNANASGNHSIAMGANTIASGDYAFATGYNSRAGGSGIGQIAMGYNATATADYSVVIGGHDNDANGVGSAVIGGHHNIAGGSYTFAAGAYSQTGTDSQYSAAIGYNATATGQSSAAIGEGTTASGDYSVAMGQYTTASGDNSIATGYVSTATGGGSVSLGTNNQAYGDNSFAAGRDSTASGISSFVFGDDVTVSGDYSFGVGRNLTVIGRNAIVFDPIDTISSTMEENDTIRVLNVDFGVDVTGRLVGGAKMDVAGAIHASSFPASSDSRLKTNITNITNVLPKLENISAITFDWNSNYTAIGRSTNKTEIGFIAQEIEPQFPELITYWDGNGSYMAVDYGRMTAVLLQAVKELKAENDALKTAFCAEHPGSGLCN